MVKKQKLELTWIGKENRPRLEPRILLEDPEKSYHAAHKVTDHDIFDNRLIFGDNLLVLKALEQQCVGEIKCIYIDPPFNTQQAFDYYDDGVEHSLWLTLMRDRLEILKNLLSSTGSVFIHIDDNEVGYLIALADEVFGRKNRVAMITFKQGSATGHKSINPGCITNTNFILWYCKGKELWNPNHVFTARDRNQRYNQFVKNRMSHHSQWQIIPLSQVFAESAGIEPRKLREVPDLERRLTEFVLSNADAVVQLARPSYDGVSKEAKKLIDNSKNDPSTVYHLKRDKYSDMYFKRGERIIFFRDTLKEIDGKLRPGEPLTALWDDIPSHNLHNEGDVEFPKGKKPEALIKRCIELASNPGDLILDSFAGSGTTGAVAHKMGRRWIMVELGEHCHTHIIPRMKKVIDGEDRGGITDAVGWKGGGGFRYYRLAPSLLEQDQFGNPVISKQHNPAMVAEAMCKLMGFTYAPSETVYWQHGHSTERDFIYVTTQTLTREQLTMLGDEVGEHRTLLICCGAFRVKSDAFPNLTLKKIPRAVLGRCEWGKDDYSLRVENLPKAPPKAGQRELGFS